MNYDAYVMIDIFSRYIVDAIVNACKECHMAKAMMLNAFEVRGVQRVVHSDGGPSMKSKAVTTLLPDLGMTTSRSRPHLSNDNPYSESIFKAMKYLPVFPDRFDGLGHTRRILDEYVNTYNHRHRHIRIGLRSRPYPLLARHAVDRNRDVALDSPPERFGTRAQHRPRSLDCDPAAGLTNHHRRTPSPSPAPTGVTRPTESGQVQLR